MARDWTLEDFGLNCPHGKDPDDCASCGNQIAMCMPRINHCPCCGSPPDIFLSQYPSEVVIPFIPTFTLVGKEQPMEDHDVSIRIVRKAIELCNKHFEKTGQTVPDKLAEVICAEAALAVLDEEIKKRKEAN